MGIGSSVHEPLGTKNLWNTPGLKLPAGLQHLAKDLIAKGHDKSKAIRLAIGIMRNWAAGRGGASPATQAKAVKVMAEFDAARARAKATPNKGGK